MNCNCNKTKCDNQNMVLGNSMDISIDPKTCESEIRADIVVSETRGIRLWGQVKNSRGEGVESVLLKLIKKVCTNNGVMYRGIAHTVSDCDGFYQFDLCNEDTRNSCYRVLVGKANTGGIERVIDVGPGNCDGYSNDNGYECKNENIYIDECYNPYKKQCNCDC